MRKLQPGNVLKVRAIAGVRVVTLAWDFAPGQEAKRDGLLGFAIERSELSQGKVIEKFYLRGIKRFKNKDQGLPPATPVPTSEHPYQSFQWGDYVADPETTYRYKVVPVYGTPMALDLDQDSATTVEIRTEAEHDDRSADGKAAHDIYFNRGVAGSQAYARQFPNQRPDPAKPGSDQMKWLSRGLYEALVRFIRRAAQADAADYKLRAMLYEFRYLPVGKAFAEARAAGADVDIRYEAQGYKSKNEAMIASAHIQGICKPQKRRDGIRHNKFIVLSHKDQPIAVWTGSTNISAGGIFGHSNVGHVVWDKAVAQQYLDYWKRLADPNVTRAPLVAADLQAEATPATTQPPDESILTLFSPRDEPDEELTLHWYADLMASAQRIVCMTFAFGLDKLFEEVLKQPGQTLRYAVFDKNIKQDVEDQISAVDNTVIAAGAMLKKGAMENFVGEKLTGFNSNYYIHDKFMLVDPLGMDPIVVTGSANFSGPSQYENDENMLVIRGKDTRVADIYFGEFMRIFDHFYTRYVAGKIEKEQKKTGKKKDPNAGYLKERAEDWVPQHFEPGRKSLRRTYFMGE